MSLVSIIIPTRNRARLLRQTIRSTVEQTWPETEIIVVDEASEDDTEAVLEQYADRINVVRHDTPQGPSVARNKGVDRSSGEYVLFLDDDDLLHPRHVEELVDFSADLPVDHIAASGWRRFCVEGSQVEVGPVVRPPSTWEAPEAICATFGHDPGCLIWGPSALWPREVFDEERWDQELYNNEDVDFYSRVLMRGYKFSGTRSGMAYYRSHGGASMSETQSTRSVVSSARCRLKHTQLLLNHPLEEEVAPAIRDSLMRMAIKLEAHGGLVDWADRVKEAYKEWGGEEYYLPQPPQNSFKRMLLEWALSLGGPKAVGWLLNVQSKIGRLTTPEQSSSNLKTMEYEAMMNKLVD